MKGKLKIAVDALMTLVLLFLMGYRLWGDVAHEWAGAGMFLLFLLHHGLNAPWHESLFRGKYTPLRVVVLVVDVLLFLTMLGLMASGVLLSNHVFAFLPLQGGVGLARLMHLVCSHWLFVLTGLHLGLHWGMFLGLARKAFGRTRPSRLRQVLLNILGGAVALYGSAVFLLRGFPGVLFLRTHFAFLDFAEPPLLFYLDYLALLGTFVFLGYSGTKYLRRTRKGGNSL